MLAPMDDAAPFFRNLSELRRREAIAQGLSGLREIGALLAGQWGVDDLRAEIERNADALRDLLSAKPGLAALLARAAAGGIHDAYADDPAVALNLTTMLGTLYAEVLEQGALTPFAETIARSVEMAARRSILSSRPQVLALGEMVDRVIAALASVHRGGRVLAIELPVGNSFATRLLVAEATARGLRIDTIRISLSRNDKPTQGTRRRDLLARRLQAARLSSTDTVVYVDEWDTGANFRNIRTLLQKLVRTSSATLLPFALVSAAASRVPEFARLIAGHDRDVRDTAIDGSRFRISMPPLRTLSKHPFFWSERDGVAGYRKMQLWGSLVSSFDRAIRVLALDAKERHKAMIMFLERAATQGGMIDPALASPRGVATFDAMFRESVSDYEQRREALHATVQPNEDGNEYAAFEDALTALATTFDARLDGHPAKLCIGIAFVYLRATGSIDPVNRYYFPAQAPMVIDLSPCHDMAHRVLLAYARDSIVRNRHRLDHRAG